MPKPKSIRNKASRSPKSKTAVRKSEAKSKAHSSSMTGGRADSKQARLIAMLRASSGVTIAAMMTTAGWQQHSVRGFLAGVIRKKLGLNLVSDESDNGRLYRIKDRKRPPVRHETTKTV
jgi:Protein of unknown function (DUF3489)